MGSIPSSVNKALQRSTVPARYFSLEALRTKLLHIDVREATFARRGFRWNDNHARQRLEQIGFMFLRGYHTALKESDQSALAQRLNLIDLELRGFAFEGAAMGLTLLDCLTPWNTSRLRSFASGPGARHVYMVHVGIGWAIARIAWLRLNLKNYLKRLHPLLYWLALDGYGFHEGYFNWPRYVEEQKTPRHLSAYALRAFDQGLGRSLWFVEGADVDRIPMTIEKFPLHRRADLWSGVGLACAYAGGTAASGIETLKRAAASYSSELAQGAAFAAKARELAGNEAEHTDLACRIFARLSAHGASAVTDEALEELRADGNKPAYEVWRERIQTRFAARNSS